MLFVFFLTVFISAQSIELSCNCNSTSTVGDYCSAKYDETGKLLVFDECKCKEGYSNLQNKVYNDRVYVFCEDFNKTSIRCFCDNKSAFSNGNICLADVTPSGITKYKSGCKCSHPLASPSIISEFFYSRVMVVHCIWSRKEDIFAESNMRRFEYDKEKNGEIPLLRKARDAADANINTSTSTSTASTSTESSNKSASTTNNAASTTPTKSHTTLTTGTTHNGSTGSTATTSMTGSIVTSKKTTSHITNTAKFHSSTSLSNETTTASNTTQSSTHATMNPTTTSRITHNTTFTSANMKTTTQNRTTTHTTETTKVNVTATVSGVTSSKETSKFTGTTVSAKSTNSTKNITKVTTSTPFWFTGNDTVDEDTFGVCNVTKFTKKNKQTAEILMYVASGWVIAWTAFAILYNIIAGVIGHHRFLDLFQEIIIIIIFVFMGVFTLKPEWSTCEANKVVLHFCMMCILLIAIMQALFLSSLIKGKSSRNSRLPVMVNYIWPPFFAAVVAVVVYFAFKKYYDGNGVHCFCEIYEKLYWAYTFPAGILFMLALLNNNMAVTACRMTRQNVDRVQLYWARRTCRGMPILMAWFCSCFFCLLFAVDMQKTWLFGVYLGLCVIFGPMLFVFHTYCYEKSCRGLFELTGFTFYKPCPTKKGDPNHVEKVVEKTDLREKKPLTDPIIPPKPEKPELPPAPVISHVVLPPPMVDFPTPMPSSGIPAPVAAPTGGPVGPHNPTSSQDFYNWLTDKSTAPGQAENVLFKKNV